jgi:hypothetical protein
MAPPLGQLHPYHIVECESCFASQQDWALMSLMGQNPLLPRRNIAGRFTSISGHNAFYLRCRRARLCLLKRIGDGDVLMVTRLDRLARSTRDLLNPRHDSQVISAFSRVFFSEGFS